MQQSGEPGAAKPPAVRYSDRMKSITATRFRRPAWLLAVLLLCLGAAPPPAFARPFWQQGEASGNGQDFLPPEIAFRVGAHLEGDQLRLRWIIADGYYLDRQKIQVTAESPDLVLGPLQLPPGDALTDAYFGTQRVYRHEVEASVRVTRQDFGAHPVQVRVAYQGCADAGLCYPQLAQVLFPTEPDAGRAPTERPLQAWEGLAIGAGCLGFLVAGLALRRGRRPLPVAS
jgi:thiol:disulfide interchange protein DsbD